MTDHPSRRSFLQTTAAAATALAVLPRTTAARAVRGVPLRAGLIGCGGRGTGAARDLVGRRTVEFNGALGRAARALGVEPVDLYGPSREELPRRPELVWSDGYHPSDAGYARWAELLWTGVAPRIAAR